MNINSIGNNYKNINQVQSKKSQNVNITADQTKAADKLEISAAAKNLKNATVESAKLQDIKAKINSKFYNSDEVINKVADAILKELK